MDNKLKSKKNEVVCIKNVMSTQVAHFGKEETK